MQPINVNVSDDILKEMRDCVKKNFIEGSSGKDEFVKMRHAIIVEFIRLGLEEVKIRDRLLEWNRRCKPSVPVSEEKNKLLKYADWVLSIKGRIGCTALESYCIGEDKCVFFSKLHKWKQSESTEPLFDNNDLRIYIEKKYPRQGYSIMRVVHAIRYFQMNKLTGRIIYVGLRTIASIIRDTNQHRFQPEEIKRLINILKDEGVIEQIETGKSGSYSKMANGYRFLPWRKPKAAEP